MKRIVSILVFISVGYSATAQRTGKADTTKKTVVVTSAFKPTIKPAAKINFSAATPLIDSSKLNLKYNVPSQNLFFTYQPVTLKPLAVSIDTTGDWENSNYVKVGFGNFSTPYLQAGLSFGDGKSSVINIHTKHVSSKGGLPFQQYSHSMAEVIGVFNNTGVTEWRGTAGFDNRVQYRYGYRPETLRFEKSDLLQRFTTFRGNVGLRNKEVNEYGISYNPSVDLNLFSDSRSGSEVNARLDAPLTKTLTKVFAINLGLTADLTSFKRKDGSVTKNNLYYLTPTLEFKTPNLVFNGGITPVWDNQVFSLLPNFTVVARLQDEQFVLQLGWVGYFNKNTYQSLATFNPWIQQPTALLNTRVKEQYFGFKGSLASHFTYNARLSLLNFSNAALYKNDSVLGNTFLPVFEPNMKAIRTHAEVGYTFQEKFSLLAGANVTNYTKLDLYDKAFGLLPLELTGALRWKVLEDLQVKADAFIWQGASYQNNEGKSKRSNSAFDINTGIEFAVMPKLNLWVQFNNLLNSHYQRWNQYEVLGFNVLGGIVYSFSQIGK